MCWLRRAGHRSVLVAARLYRPKLPAGQAVDGLLQAQQGNPAFQRVEANPIARVQGGPEPPDDPLLAQQWVLTHIGAPAAWAVTTGRREVVIAIIDTGVDLAHPDLQTQLVQGQNVLAPRTPPQDDHGHGTAIGGHHQCRDEQRRGHRGLPWLPAQVDQDTR